MTNIADLPDEIRKLMRKIIRAYCRKNKVYKIGHDNGIGPEQAEEEVERLINERKMVIYSNMDENEPVFWIEHKK